MTSHLKDLFKPKATSLTFEEIKDDLENEDLLEVLLKKKNKFPVSVDYSKPENFAKFGSAQQYYLDSIEDIYKTYPYDSSLFEKTSWSLSASDLTNYIFDNQYPKTTGYIHFRKRLWFCIIYCKSVMMNQIK